MLYRLKYNQDINPIDDIIEVSTNFINIKWHDIIEGIVPMPPSNRNRKLQPVIEIAKCISARLKLPLYDSTLIKAEERPELKNVFDLHERL